MNPPTMVLVLVQVVALAGGQVFWKMGVDDAGGFMSGGRSLLDSLLTLARTPSFLLGTALYVVATIVWIYLLARHDLGYIYPFLSLTYVVTAFGGWMILGEALTVPRLAAIGLITLGVAWLAISESA